MTTQPAPDSTRHNSWTGILETPPGAEVRIDGKSYLYFAGTAYLAMQGNPIVIQAGCDALQKYGLHTATSRGGYGASPPLLEVERLAAKFFESSAAFYFISGYWGNNLTLGALRPYFDDIFYDEHAHYSVLEAAQYTGCPTHVFAHCDPKDLATKLRERLQPGQRPLVVSDGVFASSGHIAPVDKYIEVLRDYPGSLLSIDDAHAVGVLGAGQGTYSHFSIPLSSVNQDPSASSAITSPQLYCCSTLSKALGGSGGMIAGSEPWIARVKSSSRYYNAASSPPAPVAGASAAALQIVMEQPQLRTRLRENAKALRDGLRELGLPVEDSPVPFLSLVIRDAPHMQQIQRTLREQGIIIGYFASYSGVSATGNLRIAVSAAHTPAMISQLMEKLALLV